MARRARFNPPLAPAAVVLAVLAAVLAAGGPGCAGRPRVSADLEDLGDGEGLVLGKFGVPSFHALPASDRQLLVRALPDGRARPLTFHEPLSDDEGRTAPFLARLPAGRYEVTSWSLQFLTGKDGQERPGVEFEVRPGRAVCLGALYPLHLWRPSGVPYATALIPRDECLIIDQQLRPRAPADMPTVEVALATNVLCPSCRAEVAQGGMPALSGAHDPANLPLLVAEQHRLGSDDDMPLRWPRDLPAAPRALRLRVCVTAAGRVAEAQVVDSVHPALDAQIQSRVQGWRFHPYRVEGRAAPFCYQPRWDLRRPAAASVDVEPGNADGQPPSARKR